MKIQISKKFTTIAPLLYLLIASVVLPVQLQAQGRQDRRESVENNTGRRSSRFNTRIDQAIDRGFGTLDDDSESGGLRTSEGLPYRCGKCGASGYPWDEDGVCTSCGFPYDPSGSSNDLGTPVGNGLLVLLSLGLLYMIYIFRGYYFSSHPQGKKT
jgi:ribosomal protein L37E